MSRAITLQNSIGQTLFHLPKVGQLLGRLCSLPGILSDEACYKTLMQCVLWFCVETPGDAVEVKAKSWALVSSVDY